jgi:hypothetical protein
MCEHFYPEVQTNDGSDESEDFEEFDDATPHRSQEAKASENAHAQGNDDMDGASSASSHEGPPRMIDSEDEDDERLRDRYVDKYAEDTEETKTRRSSCCPEASSHRMRTIWMDSYDAANEVIWRRCAQEALATRHLKHAP